MKKTLKIVAYFFASAIGLILLMVIFTQTVWFKNIARNKIENIVNEQLNGTLKIEEIGGTIFGGLIISDIRIEQNDSTLLYCKEVALDYNLLGILSNSIKINSVIIDSIYLSLNQDNDSTWNVMQLIKLQKEDTASTSIDWNIDVDKIKINNSNVYIATIDACSLIPHKIKNINFEAAAFISHEHKQFSINHFALETENPDFELEDILLSANLSGSKLDIPNAVIKTLLNKIQISGEYYTDDTDKSIIHIKTDPIQFDEFKEFLPNLNLNGNPTLTLVGEYFNSDAEFEIIIIDKLQTAKLKAKISDINTVPLYNAQLYINNIDVGYWLNDSSKSTNINGLISVVGSGTSIEELNLDSEIKIYDSELLHRKLDSINLNATVKNDNIQLKLKLISEFGQIDGNADVVGFNDVQRFKVNTEMKKINLAPLLLNEGLQSNLNLTIAASGNKLNYEKMNGDI
jgi:translocation and assembly module TamB